MKNSYDVELWAKDLRRKELERLLGAAGCALRQAFARIAQRPLPACPPAKELAA